MDEKVKIIVDTFFSVYPTHAYKKGELIVRVDDQPRGVMYLIKGSVKVYAISHKGEEVIVNIFKPDSFFPLSWAISDLKNSYYFEALEPVILRRAPKEVVIEFLKKNPDVMFDLLIRMYRGIDGLLVKMTYLMGEGAYVRLVGELLISARRFGIFTGVHCSLKLTERELAARTGLTRETVSRQVHELKKKKLLEVTRDAIQITDISALEKEILDDPGK